jgi:hypothetical protein
MNFVYSKKKKILVYCNKLSFNVLTCELQRVSLDLEVLLRHFHKTCNNRFPFANPLTTEFVPQFLISTLQDDNNRSGLYEFDHLWLFPSLDYN